jgi:S-DNA-T family DNA segregation ATPase FtsK/SpoIIIE
MARKSSANSGSTHGFNDVIGIVLMGFALLLLVALVSYHPKDVPANGLPTNSSIHNWIGPFGAWIAYCWFWLIGAAAYELPAVLVFLGLGCFFDYFGYLRRRWVWTVVLLLCCICLLDLYDSSLQRLDHNLQLPGAGGVVGNILNKLFKNFGTVGATIIFVMVLAISVVMLTNFHVGGWLREMWGRRGKGKGKEVAPPREEQALERHVRDLKKQVKDREEELERSGLGPDLKPVPEPTVRDLSIPQNRPGRGKKGPAEPLREPEPADEVEVISAKEVAAATTDEILGKKDGGRRSREV